MYIFLLHKIFINHLQQELGPKLTYETMEKDCFQFTFIFENGLKVDINCGIGLCASQRSKFSFRARKNRSVEALVSNIYFSFTQDIYKQFTTRIRSKAYETMEKDRFQFYK